MMPALNFTHKILVAVLLGSLGLRLISPVQLALLIVLQVRGWWQMHPQNERAHGTWHTNAIVDNGMPGHSQAVVYNCFREPDFNMSTRSGKKTKKMSVCKRTTKNTPIAGSLT
jgi:hypothetical protein